MKFKVHRIILFCWISMFVGTTTIASIAVYLNYNTLYHRDTAVAQEGMQHILHAEKLLKNLVQGQLNAEHVTQARQEFSLALNDFNQLYSDLGGIPEAATAFPKYGAMLGAAQHVLPLAIELSQAGMLGCDALTIVLPALHSPLQSNGQGITMEKLSLIKSDVSRIQSLFNTAMGQISMLQPNDIHADPRLQSAFTALSKEVPILKDSFQAINTFLGLAPVLLGIDKPTSYLIEQLDSTELRPGGGFVGSYGIVTVSKAQVAGIHLTDTYTLDTPFQSSGHSIPFPTAYQWFPLASGWSLRDSNLDADFPTSALYAEQIYHTEGGTVPIQGVIAITPDFIKSILKITGPIYVDEYRDLITSDNMVDRIHYHQLVEEWQGGATPSPDGHSSLRKRFTELLFEHLMTRLKQSMQTSTPQLFSLVMNSLHTKDVQVYVNAEGAENVLKDHQLASNIQAPSGDSLFVVDANIVSNKANDFITYTLHDQVTLDTKGDAIHHSSLTYNWPVSQASQQNNYGHTSNYIDYLRLYTPPDSVLLSQTGWIPQMNTIAFQRRVWGGSFTLPYGQAKTISLLWKVPHAATRDSSGWHYHYLIQRQAGVQWNLEFYLDLPTCTPLATENIHTKLPIRHDAQVSQNLTTDFTDQWHYRCT